MIWPFYKNIFIYDTFYLTYDEPNKIQRQKEFKKLIPNIIFIDGIKGFDRAHKACAKLSKTSRLVIIDGDNTFAPSTKKTLRLPKKLLNTDYVLSYSSTNSINGLIYGNGGIKCWPKETLLSSNSHEASRDEKSSVDFCFSTKYYQIPSSPTISNINLTSFQAFRAGFREGVKMTLNRGIALNEVKNVEKSIYKSNFFRLKTWCEIGRDADNGIWAIYGARLGLYDILTKPYILDKIRDYDWFQQLWDQVKLNDPEQEAIRLSSMLSSRFELNLIEYNEFESSEFKKKVRNPHREGLMFPED